MDSFRRPLAFLIVLVAHCCLVGMIEFTRPAVPKAGRETAIDLMREDHQPAIRTFEQLPPNLKAPSTVLVVPPVIEIVDEGTTAGSSTRGADASVLPPRPDPQFPNAPPSLPATLGAALAGGRSIIVVVRALVLESGSVGDASISSSSGLAEIDALALRQVKDRWHFLPASSKGKSIRDWILVEVLFKSETGDSPA